MPKVGEREPITKLSRSTLDRLTRPQPCNNFKPLVVSRCVRIHGGARRGARLILLSSLLDFISRQPGKLPTKSTKKSLAEQTHT
jgi:hypothetical protein